MCAMTHVKEFGSLNLQCKVQGLSLDRPTRTPLPLPAEPSLSGVVCCCFAIGFHKSCRFF